MQVKCIVVTAREAKASVAAALEELCPLHRPPWCLLATTCLFARSGVCGPPRPVISEGCPCLGCHALFSVGCQKPPSFASAGAETCCEGYPPPKKQGSLSLCWGPPPLPCPTLSCPPAWLPSVPAWPRPPLPGLLDAGLRAAPLAWDRSSSFHAHTVPPQSPAVVLGSSQTKP